MRKFLLFLLTGIVLLHAEEADEEGLRILNAVPRGSIESLSQANMILVVFSEPMVPLSAITGEVSFPLEIEPPIEGKLRWLGTMMLAFEPADSLPYATEFRVRVPAGVRSVRGHELREDYVWTFSTPAPKLIFSIPGHGDRFVDIEMPLILIFNQPMDSAAARDYIELYNEGTKKLEKFKIRHISSDTASEDWQWLRHRYWGYRGGEPRLPWRIRQALKRRYIPDVVRRCILVISSLSPLDTGAAYTLRIKDGIKGAEGNLPGIGDDIFFITYGAFEFLGLNEIEMRDIAGNLIKKGRKKSPEGELVFLFTNPVAPSSLSKYLHISPEGIMPETGSRVRCRYGGYQWTEFYTLHAISMPCFTKLLPDTEYLVTLSDSLTDIFGNRLKKRYVFKFRTGDYSEVHYFAIRKKILEARQHPICPVVVRNIDSLRIQMSRIRPPEVVELMTADSVKPEKGIFYRGDSQCKVRFEVDTVVVPDFPKNKKATYTAISIPF